MARRRISFFLDGHLEAGLKELKARVGIPQAEAIRRAISEYLKQQGVVVDATGERAPAARGSRRSSSKRGN